MRVVLFGAVLGWTLLAAALAAPDSAAEPERQRLATERLTVEARFAAEEAECRQRFMVTDCVDDVRQRRRAALAGLREQELVLDDAARRARVAERQRAVALKSAEAASRPAPVPISLAPAEAADASAPASQLLSPLPLPDLRPSAAASAATAASAAVAQEPVRRKGPDPEAVRDAARRAAASEQRRLDGEAERARIAGREAERAARGKPVVPLPLPAELAGSGVAR